MENNKLEKDMSLKDVLGRFIQSYAQRDADVAFSDWLAGRMRQELPEMAPEVSDRLVDDIVEAVAGYDQTLHNLNQAIEAGQSKEEWLSDQLAEAYEGMPLDAVGESLQHLETNLIESNMQLMGETGVPTTEGPSATKAQPAEWNKYSVKAKSNSIGRLLNSVVLCAAAGALERNLNGERVAISDIVTDALQNGLKASPDEVKAVVAGAVRTYVGRGLMDNLPSDTSIEVIGGFAGVAVEGVGALCDAANGEITMTEALDKVGRAGLAFGCRIGAGFLKENLVTLPGGPILVDLFGGLLDHIGSSQFANNVYATVHGLAVATWEGIKQSTTVEVIKEVVRRARQWQ